MHLPADPAAVGVAVIRVAAADDSLSQLADAKYLQVQQPKHGGKVYQPKE